MTMKGTRDTWLYYAILMWTREKSGDLMESEC